MYVKGDLFIRPKRQARLNSSGTQKAGIEIKGFIQKCAVPFGSHAAFMKFLKTEQGKVWARQNLTPREARLKSRV
jgi:hypothetical protein